MGIKYLDKELQEVLRGFQEKDTGLILRGVDVGESTSLRRSLMCGYAMEVLNRGLDTAVIGANNRRRKRERVRGGGDGLIKIIT